MGFPLQLCLVALLFASGVENAQAEADEFPVLIFSKQDPILLTDFSSNGNSDAIKLPGTFKYFGNFYNTLYINMNGFLSFLGFSGNNPDPIANEDIIAPLWTNFNYERIYYEQVTTGSFLDQATAEINRIFPGLYFSASWLFITTWNATYSTSTGVATFQTVLVGGEDDELSFLLINYGDIAPTDQAWLAGYRSESGLYNYTIDQLNPSDLSESTNINITGRWAFRVDGDMDTCEKLQCTENEVCVERTGIYGCDCSDDNLRPNPDTFDVNETCSGSSGTVSLSRCQLFEAGYSAQFLHLNDPKCKGMMKGERVVFHFDNDEYTCGTVLTKNATHFIYENKIQAVMGKGDHSVISRDNWLTIDISCVYPLIQSFSMPMVIHPNGSVISKDLSMEGTYEIHMLPYRDPLFSTLFPSNGVLNLNDLIFVAVDVVGVDSSQISIVLDRCWATPSHKRDDEVYWDLIIDECPNPEDGTVQVLQNGVSTSSRFSFRMFTFTSISSNIYLHCKVYLCLVESGQCVQSCPKDHASRRRRSLDFHDTAEISMGF